MTFLLPVLTFFITTNNVWLSSYFPVLTVQERIQLVETVNQQSRSNGQEKVTVINTKSGNVQTVAAPAAANSPVFVPCDDCDPREKKVLPTSLPTEPWPTVQVPTPIPFPTYEPEPTIIHPTFIPVITIEPEPSMPYPIDPPPCDWKKYPPRPDWQLESAHIIEMPCIYLDQQ